MGKAGIKGLYLIVSLIYVVFSITSTVSHCWVQATPENVTLSHHHRQLGLFMQCTDGEEYCKDLPEDEHKMPEWWWDMRALVIVSCLFSSFATYVEILHLLFEKVQRYFTTVVMFLANLLLLIALSMYTKKVDDFEVYNKFGYGGTYEYKYGWGFILSWVAFVVGIAVIVIGAVSAKSINREFELNMSAEEPSKKIEA